MVAPLAGAFKLGGMSGVNNGGGGGEAGRAAAGGMSGVDNGGGGGEAGRAAAGGMSGADNGGGGGEAGRAAVGAPLLNALPEARGALFAAEASWRLADRDFAHDVPSSNFGPVHTTAATIENPTRRRAR